MRDETAAQVLAALTARGEKLAVAESLTGGMVAAALTRVPGASKAFSGSVTAYATEVKRRVLGVDGELLDASGAVDAEVSRQMATGVRELLGAEWGLATTGVAGPEEQDGKPVGTVFVAVVGPPRGPVSKRLLLRGDRVDIQSGSVSAALELLFEELADKRAPNDTEYNGGI